MEHFGPVVSPADLDVDGGGALGSAAVAAFATLVVLMIAVIPALYFTWHTFKDNSSVEPNVQDGGTDDYQKVPA